MDSAIPSHGRAVPGGNAPLRAGEHVVYHFSAKTFVRCAPNGDALDGFNEMGYVFNDFSKAQDYCRWKVSELPKLGCLIYDHDWKIVEQFTNPQYMEQINRGNSPQQQLIKGILFLIAGVALISLDAWHNWMLMIGFLVGARLAVGGIVKIALSLSDWQRPSVRD